MIKLKSLITENEVQDEEDLGKPHVVTEAGYYYLKSKIEELNKKAAKWGVPPMELKVNKEEFIKKKIPVNSFTGNLTNWEDPAVEAKEVTTKQYEVEIIGLAPKVEGYQFIAKLEHTPDGNIMNYAPRLSDKHLPTEYRTANQSCDVCHTNRDRNNTFILKLTQDDPERFPNKKSGDFIMVGSTCLKRFLGTGNAEALMQYAEMIELIRSSINSAGEMEDDFGGGGRRVGNYMSQEGLGLWLSAVYLHTGKYISKKKAEEFQSSSSLDDAFFAMTSKEGQQHESEVHLKMRTDQNFYDKVKAFRDEFLQWSKTKDFDTIQQQKPEFADFFNNLKIIAKQENFKINNSGLFSALFQMFLRDKGELEKQAQLKAAKPTMSYFGQIGQKAKAKVKVTKIKEYQSQYGTGLIVNMEAEATEIDPTTNQEVKKTGNLLYFTSPTFKLSEGDEAEIEFTVKNHQENKYTTLPETQITRAKILNYISKSDKNQNK